MVTEDVTLMNRHLEELYREVVELRQSVEEMKSLAREETLLEVYEALTPLLVALSELDVSSPNSSDPVVSELRQALPQLGLERTYRVGEELELFPEDAQRELTLDGDIPEGASMVRVRVEASGWRRGFKTILNPVGRLLKVIHENDV